MNVGIIAQKTAISAGPNAEKNEKKGRFFREGNAKRRRKAVREGSSGDFAPSAAFAGSAEQFAAGSLQMRKNPLLWNRYKGGKPAIAAARPERKI
jgi:hypothetical protein